MNSCWDRIIQFQARLGPNREPNASFRCEQNGARQNGATCSHYHPTPSLTFDTISFFPASTPDQLGQCPPSPSPPPSPKPLPVSIPFLTHDSPPRSPYNPPRPRLSTPPPAHTTSTTRPPSSPLSPPSSAPTWTCPAGSSSSTTKAADAGARTWTRPRCRYTRRSFGRRRRPPPDGSRRQRRRGRGRRCARRWRRYYHQRCMPAPLSPFPPAWQAQLALSYSPGAVRPRINPHPPSGIVSLLGTSPPPLSAHVHVYSPQDFPPTGLLSLFSPSRYPL
jgi:hypothetical protein